MTLYRQIVIIIAIVLSLIFSGVFWINIKTTRNYLQEQLDSHAQDTATSLGLSLSPHMKSNDMAIIESMIDAIFDRGYYKSIRLVDMNNEVLVSRSLPIEQSNIPSWFTDNIRLETPLRKALVTSGWRQGGVLYVQSHPGFAYRELWYLVMEMLIWVFILFVTLSALGLLAIRIILKPLEDVERQAMEITEKKFNTVSVIPKTRELRNVVTAMNYMTQKLKSIFQEQLDNAIHWKSEASEDIVTGLYNRRFFDSALKSWLQSTEDNHLGIIYHVHLNGISQINDVYGMEKGDEFLRDVANILRETLLGKGDALLTRYTGSSYIFIASGEQVVDKESLAEDLLEEIKGMFRQRYPVSEQGCKINIYACRAGEEIEDIQFTLNEALQKSGFITGYDYSVIKGGSMDRKKITMNEWDEIFTNTLTNRKIHIMVQGVESTADINKEVHREVLMRISSDVYGLLTAGEFLSKAEYLNKQMDLDKLIIEKVLESNAVTESNIPLAVNLSIQSFENTEFRQWLLKKLEEDENSARKIAFEVSEVTILNSGGDTLNFISGLRQLGSQFGIDHFGTNEATFSYMQSIRPDYIKIDGAYGIDVETNQEHQFFIRTLVSAAHSLDILVITEMVTNAQQKNILTDIGVDGLQGFYIEKPVQMDE